MIGRIGRCSVVNHVLLRVFLIFFIYSSNAEAQNVDAGASEAKQAFRRLSESSLKGCDYVTARDRFLLFGEATTILKETNVDRSEVVSQALSLSLLGRMENREAYLSVERKLSEAIVAIVERREGLPPITRSGRESRPDPMYQMRCVQEPKTYLAEYITHIEKSGAWEGVPREKYVSLITREIRTTTWDKEMLFLGPCMLEVALKGWPDEEAVAELKKKGWGDFYRYMAVHILGELRFKEAADYLALVFGDEKEDRYLRAHAARALSKIADSKHLALLAEHLFLKDLPQEAQREVKFDAFDAGQVVRVLKELLPRATDRERRCRIISALAERTRRGDPLTMMQARDVLQSALAVEKDPQVRLTIKNYLESLSDATQPSAPRYERTDLAFDDCTPADDWDVMRDAAEGKAEAAALQEARKRYLSAVDSVARKYTNANVFATKELHSDGWPGNVDDEEARAFFKTVASLKPGMSRIDVLAKLPADLWIEPHDPDYTLGKEVVWHRVAKQFSKEVEGPFGLRRKDCEFILVFVNDKLRVIHARH